MSVLDWVPPLVMVKVKGLVKAAKVQVPASVSDWVPALVAKSRLHRYQCSHLARMCHPNRMWQTSRCPESRRLRWGDKPQSLHLELLPT